MPTVQLVPGIFPGLSRTRPAPIDIDTGEKRPMTAADGFKHLRLDTLGGVVLIEVTSKEIQGPDLAKEFIGELTRAVGLNGDKPLLLDLRWARYFSSMGYSALFKLVKCAKERRRPVKFCNMHEDVRVGAEAVGLPQVVEIHDSEAAALEAFARA
jgi:anti-anti-sigma regulatory factor